MWLCPRQFKLFSSSNRPALIIEANDQPLLWRILNRHFRTRLHWSKPVNISVNVYNVYRNSISAKTVARQLANNWAKWVNCQTVAKQAGRFDLIWFYFTTFAMDTKFCKAHSDPPAPANDHCTGDWHNYYYSNVTTTWYLKMCLVRLNWTLNKMKCFF